MHSGKRKLLFFYWAIFTTIKIERALRRKKCYFGPFTGEFGHLLGHNLPFISYLYSKNVKVIFCGLSIHKPFFRDDKNISIVSNYIGLRDFFDESLPDCNMAKLPDDVNITTNEFIRNAKESKDVYFDNSNLDYYFNFFRWWIVKKGYVKTFDLSKVSKNKIEKSVVIFPRKWNLIYSENQLKNNGENWDYLSLAKIASKYFTKVYVLGHPAFSDANFSSFDNVEVLITNDNAEIIEKCSKSRLIITQHSGSVYLGEYTNTPVLIIYKGGNIIGDINTTIHFKKSLGTKSHFNFAYSYSEIDKFLMDFNV